MRIQCGTRFCVTNLIIGPDKNLTQIICENYFASLNSPPESPRHESTFFLPPAQICVSFSRRPSYRNTWLHFSLSTTSKETFSFMLLDKADSVLPNPATTTDWPSTPPCGSDSRQIGLMKSLKMTLWLILISAMSLCWLRDWGKYRSWVSTDSTPTSTCGSLQTCSLIKLSSQSGLVRVFHSPSLTPTSLVRWRIVACTQCAADTRYRLLISVALHENIGTVEPAAELHKRWKPWNALQRAVLLTFGIFQEREPRKLINHCLGAAENSIFNVNAAVRWLR